MSYTKQTWQTGDTITAEKLNHIEDGVDDASRQLNDKITSPTSPASGAFLVWNGTAWVAQTLATWQGGSY